MVRDQHIQATTPSTPYPMPELAGACRALLRTVDLEARWTDHGPDATASAWLAATDRPPELLPDQWTMLRVCAGVWEGDGLLDLQPRSLYQLGAALQAYAIDGLDGLGAWSGWQGRNPSLPA